LLAAARRLEELDLVAARETYLWALGAALQCLDTDDPRLVAEAGLAVPAGAEPAGALLTGLATWVLDGSPPSLSPVPEDDLSLLRLTVPIAQETWDDDAWHRRTELAVDAARRAGALAILVSALTFRAGVLIHAGRFADASTLLDEATSIQDATGLAGDPAAALLMAALRGEDKPLAAAEGRLAAVASHARAVLCNGLGQYTAAVKAATRAAERADLGVTNWALTELVEAAAHAGEAAIAATARDRLAERTAAAGTNWALGTQALADALVTSAEDRYIEAIDRFDATRLGLLAARARLLYGEWLRRENRRVDARAQLRLAHDAFTVAGATAFADRAGRELTATGETVRKRTADAVEELTPQEVQIARLAVAGRTNPEIAATLFLSPRTVEWHLRKVFTKLGIASRRELAGALR
jgi:DNA-binding CsgD family transcriptional regulator